MSRNSVRVLCGLVAATNVAVAQGRPQRTSADVTAPDLAARLSILAHDSMLGREAGQPGNVKATDYIAAELRRLGVEPAGENGTYFQTLPMVLRSVDSASALQSGAGTVAIGDLYPLRAGLGGNPFAVEWFGEHVPLVFGGRLGSPDMISPDAAHGRFVVFLPAMAQNGQPFGNLTGPGGVLARYTGAAAVAVAGLESASAPARAFLRQVQVVMVDSTVPSPPSVPGVALTTAAAERLLGGPLASMQPGQVAGEVSGRFGFARRPVPAPARNVVGIVRGRDARMRHTYVAIGAHTDHDGVGPVLEHDSVRAYNTVIRPLGANNPVRAATPDEAARIAAIRDSLRRRGAPRADSIFNGSDDDASGVAVVLELAEYFQRHRPARSLLLVFHNAEEKGLLGAAYYTDHPTVPRDSVVAMVNLDQVSRGGSADVPGSPDNSVYLLGTRRLSTGLGDLVEAINTRGHNLNLNYEYDADGHPANGYCRSDHYMYARYGIPVVFLSAGWHRDYHQVTDEIQYASIGTMQKVALFVRDIVAEVARGERPVVDKPRPDPRAPCRQ